MKIRTLALLLVVISLLGIVFFLLLDTDIFENPPQAMEFTGISISDNELAVGEELLIEGVVTGSSLATVEYESSSSSQHKDCLLGNTCSFSFKDKFNSGSIEQVKITAYNVSGEKITEKRNIYVISSTQTCIDGTLFAGCSVTKPLSCENGKLIENCSKCGCLSHQFCRSDNICAGKGINLLPESVSFKPPSPLRPGAEFTPELSVNSTDTIYKNSEFNIEVNYLDSFGNVVVNQGKRYIFEEDFLGNQIKVISLPRISISQNTILDIKVQLTGILDASGSVSEPVSADFKEALIISDDLTAPAPPSNLSAAYTDGILLQWLPSISTDVASYRIYESNNINPAYVSYALRISVPSDSQAYLISNPQPGKSYFVITAVDKLGNESGYSNVAEFELI